MNTGLLNRCAGYRARAAIGALACALIAATTAPGLLRATEGWQNEVRLTDDPGTSRPAANNGRFIAVDHQGRVHVVWADDRDRIFEIYHAFRSQGVWQPAQRVTNSGGESLRPVVAVDWLGRLHLVWNDTRDGNREIYHAIWDGSWHAPQRVTNTAGESFAPSIAAIEGDLHLVHIETNAGVSEIIYRRFDLFVWSDPVRLTDVGTGGRLVPSIAAGPDGSLHVAWWDARDAAAGAIGYRSRGAGLWTDEETVSGLEADAMRPTVCVDDSGHVHVAWIDARGASEQIYHRRRRAGGWDPETRVTTGDFTHYHPSIVWAGGETTLLYWAADPGGQTAGAFVQTLAGGVWNSRVRISGSDSRASLCCLYGEEDGRLHAAWTDDRHGNFEIYYNEYVPPGSGVGEEDDGPDAPLPSPLSLAVSPNPFHDSAWIELATPGHAAVSIRIYDVAGRCLRTVVSPAPLPQGLHRFEWDGCDDGGRSLPPGIYFARARAGKHVVTVKSVRAR